MKSRLKKIFLTIIFTVSVLSIANTTYAYVLLGNPAHGLINGAGNYGRNNQYYYINPNLGNEASRIDRIMSRWVHSTGTSKYTPLSFARTQTQANAVIDFHKSNKNEGTVQATTYWMTGNAGVAAVYSNWYWAKIDIHNDYYNRTSGLRDAIVGHEIGHAFGLNHTGGEIYGYKGIYKDNVNSLMNGNVGAINTWAYYPQNDEFDAINQIYKNRP